MRGYLKFVDVKNKKTDCWFTGLPFTATPQALETFAGVLKPFVNPAITEFGVVKMDFEEITSTAAGIVSAPVEGTSNKDKAMVTFTYIGEYNDTRVITLWIPNPHKIGNFVHVEGVGYRMSQMSGNDLAAALSDAMGVGTVTFVQGKIEYKESRKAGPNSMHPSIMFQDINGDLAYMGLPYQFTNIGAVAQFADQLNGNGLASGVSLTLTDSKILRAFYPNPSIAAPSSGNALLTADTETGWDSIDRQAKLRFSYIKLGTKRTMSLSLPGIKAAAMEIKAGRKGYAMLKTVGETLAANLTTMYGGTSVRSIKFEHGKLDALNLQPQ